MNFSKKYLKLTESMRSISEEDLLEDKDTKKQKKEKKKEKKWEKKFNQGGAEEYSSGTGKFNLNAFLKALTALKNQIISQLTDADTVKKINPDLKTPEKYKSEFMGFLERTAKLMGDVEYTKSKEGKKLESGDEALISGYRDIYNKIEAQFKEKKEAYTKEVQEERIEAQKGLEFKGILDPLNSAIAKFGEAEVMMTELLTNLSNKAQTGGAGTGSQLKIEKPISEWTKGKPANDRVKKIQQMIFDKFKGNSDVTGTQIWKDFSSGNFADGKNGRKTSNMVVALKSAFGLADTSSDITQEFVDQLMAVKESASLSESLISYDDFIAPKKIKEGFDPEAFKKTAGEIKKPAAGSGGGAPASFDAFDSKEEGNKFRAWVNDKHPEWAKENSLDKEGSHTNSYIKKAWDEFGKEYEDKAEIPEGFDESLTPIIEMCNKYNSAGMKLMKKGEKRKKDTVRVLSKHKPLAYYFYSGNTWKIFTVQKKGSIGGLKFLSSGNFSEDGKKIEVTKGSKRGTKIEKDTASINNFYLASGYQKPLSNKEIKEMASRLKEQAKGSFGITKAFIDIEIDDEGNPYIDYSSSGGIKGTIKSNRKVTYKTSSGKTFNGTLKTGSWFMDWIKGNVAGEKLASKLGSSKIAEAKFTVGKTVKSFPLIDVVTGNITQDLSGDSDEVQGKKAYPASTGSGYVNVRTSPEVNTGYVNNLLYKHTSGNIGLVISSKMVKGKGKVKDYRWYKIQFPEKKKGREFGWVREDTVDLK